MDESSPYDWFIQEWKEYLRLHRQTVLSDSEGTDIIQSVNTKTGRYRWILKCVEEDTYRVSSADRKAWRRQLRLAQQLQEKCYLVIKFGSPARAIFTQNLVQNRAQPCKRSVQRLSHLHPKRAGRDVFSYCR